MKTEAFQSLIVAKTLLEQVDNLMLADNKFSSSAALVVLQDGFELIMKAALIEKGVDETKNLERMSFDELISELKSQEIRVHKSGTLKAMNKGRVTVKHYGQLAEHDTVKNFVDATRLATAVVMSDVFNTRLTEVFVGGHIEDNKIRTLLREAADHIDNRRSFDAMIAVRKAIFISIEKDYDVSSFADPDKRKEGLLSFLGRGSAAPFYAKNPDYIAANVREPFDYIVLNHEKIKIDLMEWGVHTQEFWNVWRLTPRVYQAEDSTEWLVSSVENVLTDDEELEAARYCLDRTLNVLQKKQSHNNYSKFRPSNLGLTELRIKSDTPRLRKASKEAEIVDIVKTGKILPYEMILHGLDGNIYFRMNADYKNKEWFNTYILSEDCEMVNVA